MKYIPFTKHAVIKLGIRYFFILLGMAIVFLAMARLFLPDDMCGNDIIGTGLSPDKQLRVVIFYRDCGATTGYGEQVSILDSRHSLPNTGGNIFITDDNHGAAPNGVNIETKWLNSRQLQISYDNRARIFKKKKQYKGVSILYQEIE